MVHTKCQGSLLDHQPHSGAAWEVGQDTSPRWWNWNVLVGSAATFSFTTEEPIQESQACLPPQHTQCSASDVPLCILSGWCPPQCKPWCVLLTPALAMRPACAHTRRTPTEHLQYLLSPRRSGDDALCCHCLLLSPRAWLLSSSPFNSLPHKVSSAPGTLKLLCSSILDVFRKMEEKKTRL